ncbi:hypothetical protein U9M48_022887 [Paspalum notatum var. saurae]|uniref:Cathepsin propeptide inhibitor domain-containing protein n=1 Tax=Paspalum notatum var. saurae TaxID=547442 RepID=A0AAQ3TJ52_PASNO
MGRSVYEELMMIARDAATARRAARLAADAASRAARWAAASRPARAAAAAAAASRAARSAVFPASRAAFEVSNYARSEFPEDHQAARLRARGAPPPPPPQIEYVPGKSVTKEDLESDEATQALYERWCKAYNKQRGQGDMARRFNIFKQGAEHAYKNNHHLGPAADGYNAQEFAQYKRSLARLGVHVSPKSPLLVEDIPDQSP